MARIAPPDDPSAGKLDAAIVGNGYVLPGSEHWVLGSTYEQTPWREETATEHNIKSNRAFLGKLRCNRCITSALLDAFHNVRQGSGKSTRTLVSTAHGSWVSSAPFAASIIASELLGWIPPASPRARQCRARPLC